MKSVISAHEALAPARRTTIRSGTMLAGTICSGTACSAGRASATVSPIGAANASCSSARRISLPSNTRELPGRGESPSHTEAAACRTAAQLSAVKRSASDTPESPTSAAARIPIPVQGTGAAAAGRYENASTIKPLRIPIRRMSFTCLLSCHPQVLRQVLRPRLQARDTSVVVSLRF